MVNVRFGYRRHCGGLKESLETKQYITFEEFIRFLPEYDFYSYDKRCNQVLFILKDMENKINCFKNPGYKEYLERDWLFIEVEQHE